MTIRLSGSSKTLHRAISTETGNTCCVSRYPCLRSCSQCSRATGSKPKPRGSALALAPTRMTCSPGQQNAVSISTCTCTRKTTPTALRNGSRVIRRQAKLLAWTSSPTTNKVNTVWQQAAIVTECFHTYIHAYAVYHSASLGIKAAPRAAHLSSGPPTLFFKVSDQPSGVQKTAISL